MHQFYVPVGVTKRYECTQEDVRKIVGTIIRNVPSRVRLSQKNPQVNAKERYQRETELDSLEKKNKGMKNNSRTE